LKPSLTSVSATDGLAASAQKSWSATEVKILEAARHLIADEGHHNFSMRGIAQKSGIHLKSLQYYFRTKQELLTSVANYTIEKYYFETYDKMFAEKRAVAPRERFALMLDHLLADLSDPFTARLFPELWALANHDEDVAAALDLFYVRHIASIEKMVIALNPTLSADVALHRAALAAMTIEGLVLILGHGKTKRAEYEGLLSVTKETILRLVMLPTQTEPAEFVSLAPAIKSNTRNMRSRKQ
jgi:AcrR family transcriptional regulator